MYEKTNTIPVKQITDLLENIQQLYVESELYDNEIVRKAVGKSYYEVIEVFKNFHFQNDCSHVNPERFILEIRRGKYTISCVFHYFICTEAYVFNDNTDA